MGSEQSVPECEGSDVRGRSASPPFINMSDEIIHTWPAIPTETELGMNRQSGWAACLLGAGSVLSRACCLLYIRLVGRNNKKLVWGHAFGALDEVVEQLQGALHLHPIEFERSKLYDLCVMRMEE